MRHVFIATVLGWSALCQGQQNVPTPSQSDPSHFASKLNVVLVPVLVRDARGQAVGALKQADFQVFDNGKQQAITGFTVENRPLASSSSEVRESPPTATNLDNAKTTVPERFIIFLFDDLHLSASDLIQAQEAATKTLGDSLSGKTAAAVFSISGATNSGLTLDRTKLENAVKSVRLSSAYRQIGHPCPDLTYGQSELILRRNDDQAFKASVAETMACSGLRKQAAEERVRAAASQALNLGAQGTRITLQMIKFIVTKMAALPGQRTLVLISPGFLTMDASNEKSELIDVAARANITISALDARGLSVNELPASNPLSTSPDVLRMKSTSYASAASSSKDVLAELTYGTGGTYFHNTNDLAAGFVQLTRAPEFLYLLEFTPTDVAQNGSYHRLKVTVDRKALEVRARQGYYAANIREK